MFWLTLLSVESLLNINYKYHLDISFHMSSFLTYPSSKNTAISFPIFCLIEDYVLWHVNCFCQQVSQDLDGENCRCQCYLFLYYVMGFHLPKVEIWPMLGGFYILKLTTAVILFHHILLPILYIWFVSTEIQTFIKKFLIEKVGLNVCISLYSI